MNFDFIKMMIAVENLWSLDSDVSKSVFLIETVTKVYN